MKNVTLSMSEELLKAGRTYAARRQTTLNQLVRDLLADRVGERRTRHRARALFASMDAGAPVKRNYRWRRGDAYDV